MLSSKQCISNQDPRQNSSLNENNNNQNIISLMRESKNSVEESKDTISQQVNCNNNDLEGERKKKKKRKITKETYLLSSGKKCFDKLHKYCINDKNYVSYTWYLLIFELGQSLKNWIHCRSDLFYGNTKIIETF